MRQKESHIKLRCAGGSVSRRGPARVHSRSMEDMLRVKKLADGARAPVVAHPGEDLGYDLFALEGTRLRSRQMVKVRTGIAVEARDPQTGAGVGLLVRDR